MATAYVCTEANYSKLFSVIHTVPHKEEGTHRRQLYATDQAKIPDELSKHVNPLVTYDTPLCNIINGTSYDIEQHMAVQLISSLPHGLYKSISTIVVTMETHIYEMVKLYAMLFVVSQDRDIYLSDIFKYKLSPVPPSLFDEYGDVRKTS